MRNGNVPLRESISFAALLLVILFCSQCRAQDYVWSAGAAGNWSVSTNWTPNGRPGSADTVTFNATSVKNSTVDTNFSVVGVTLASGYTGTIVFSNSATLTIGSGGLSQAAGTFDFSAAGGVSCASNWVVTGGASVCSAAAVVLTFNEPVGNFTFTQPSSGYGAINHSGAGTIQCVDSFGLFAKGRFTQSGTGTFILSDKQQLLLGGITVSGGSMDMHLSSTVFCGFGADFTQSGGALSAPSGLWALRGQFTKTGGTFVAGTSSITMEPQTNMIMECGGAEFNNFQYFSTVNLTLGSSDLVVNGDFTIFRQDSRLGTVDCNGRNVTVGGLTKVTDGTLNCGSGLLLLKGGLLVGGDTVPNIPQSSSGTVNMGSSTIVTTDFTLLGTNGGANFGIGTLNMNTGTLKVSGNWSRPNTFTNASVFNQNTSTIEFNKLTGTQTLDLSIRSTAFYNFIHSGAGSLMVLNNPLSVANNFVNSAGIFSNGGQNVFLNGSATLSKPADAVSEMDVGSGNTFFLSLLTIQGATITTGALGTSYYNGPVFASNGAGGDKSTLAGNVNLFGNTVSFDVSADSELDVPGSVANGAVTKANGGTMVLSNATNPYTGATLILGGTFVVNSLQPASAVSVNAGATLAGNGTVGAVTIANGGGLTPSAGPNAGALTAAGNSTLSSGSTYKVGLRGAAFGQFDKFFVQGTVNLDGSALTGTATPFPAPPGTKLVILDNDGTDAIVGKFTSQPEGSTVTLGGRLFKISYVGGSGNDVELTTINSAPVLNGSLSATPNPAAIGQTVTLIALASDVDGDTLTYTWDFGDGTTGAGASVVHLFNSAGSYTATVAVSDGTAAPVSGSIQISVVSPKVGTGNDTDGDGFSDAFENAVGTQANDATSTPIGGPATTVGNLTVSKPSIALNFSKPGSDAIKFSGTLDVPAGFVGLGKNVYVDVGGVSERFAVTKTNSAKGGLNGPADTIKISIKSSRGVVAAQKAAFSVSLSKGSFQTQLADEQFTNGNVAGEKRTVVFTVLFNNTILQKSQDMFYTAKQGKTGKAK